MTKDLVLYGSALSHSDKILEPKCHTCDCFYRRERSLHKNFEGMKASLEASQPVDEELFEIHIDTQGCQDGPKTARLRAETNKPKVFDGLKFYFFGEFYKGYKEDLQNLVKVAGGTILKTEDELSAESSNNVSDERSSSIVVYNIDPPPGCALGEEVTIIWQRASEAEALSCKNGCRVVGHTWLLESIAGYKLHPMIS